MDSDDETKNCFYRLVIAIVMLTYLHFSFSFTNQQIKQLMPSFFQIISVLIVTIKKHLDIACLSA